MSETNPSGNSAKGQSFSKTRPSAVIAVVSGLLVVLSLGAGFWLGRHELNRTVSGPATQPAPAAPTAAEQDAEAKRGIERATMQIQLLDKEKNLLELELNEDIIRKIAMKELALGGDQIDTFWQWNGKSRQLERLIDDRLRILSETAGLQSQRDAIASRSGAGSTPSEIEAQIRSNPRYLDLAHNADEAARQVDELKSQSKPDDASLEVATRRSTAAAARLAAAHDELRATLADAMKDHLNDKINADTADLARVDKFIETTSAELGTLNQEVADLRVLRDRETHIREKLDTLQDRLAELRLFGLQGIPVSDIFRAPQASNRALR